VWWFSVNLKGEDSDVCFNLEINWIYGVLFHFLSIVHKLHGYFKKELSGTCITGEGTTTTTNNNNVLL